MPNTIRKPIPKIGYYWKITSCVIIVIAALWAPQIGKFGSLLKYYQEMLSYIAPPIVAAFLLGVFNKRINGNGAFAGLLGGLVIAIGMLFLKMKFWKYALPTHCTFPTLS